jgi:hypothetical protein
MQKIADSRDDVIIAEGGRVVKQFLWGPDVVYQLTLMSRHTTVLWRM